MPTGGSVTTYPSKVHEKLSSTGTERVRGVRGIEVAPFFYLHDVRECRFLSIFGVFQYLKGTTDECPIKFHEGVRENEDERFYYLKKRLVKLKMG